MTDNVKAEITAANEEEDYAPLGSGIALLAALGGAYLLGKKHKEEA